MGDEAAGLIEKAWVTHTRQVPYTVTETYQEWVPGRWVTKTRQVPVYSTRVTSYAATKTWKELVGYTATKDVYGWVGVGTQEVRLGAGSEDVVA